jgi:hypothetical protein
VFGDVSGCVHSYLLSWRYKVLITGRVIYTRAIHVQIMKEVLYLLFFIFLALQLRFHLNFHSHRSQRSRDQLIRHTVTNNNVQSINNTTNMWNSVLYCIACESFDRIDTVEILLDNAVDWCEGGYQVQVIIDTHDMSIDAEKLTSELIQRHKCSTEQFLLKIVQHDPTILERIPESFLKGIKAAELSLNLAIYHRHHFSEYLRLDGDEAIDIFVYSEDDMSLRLHSLNRWVEETKRLQREATSYYVGFIRYENARYLSRRKNNIANIMPNFSFSEASVPLARLSWEVQVDKLRLLKKTKNLDAVGVPGNHFLTLPNDPNAVDDSTRPYGAVAAYTREQLLDLEGRCLFLSQQYSEPVVLKGLPTAIRRTEFYGSQQPYHCGCKELISLERIKLIETEYSCCKEWVIPSANFESLFVHHIGSPGYNADMKWANKHRLPNATFINMWRRRVNRLLNDAES